MKNLILAIFLIVILLLNSCKQKLEIDSYDIADMSSYEKIESLIAQMTIEEKVGQMTQIASEVFFEDGVLQLRKLRSYILDNHIGSILNTYNSAIPISEWRKFITLIQDIASESQLKIPVLYGIDAIHGCTYAEGATLFPHNIGMAATRNLELVKQAAAITAKETRAMGIRWNFDPVLGVGRQPLWPRFEETYGESSFLVGEMGTATIETYEGENLKNVNSVASCMKHYLGYSVPENGKDRTPAYIPDIMLREIFVPPFKKAIDAGSSSIMINSASINGVPVHCSKKLLTDLLRNELGFKGMIVTDWQDIEFLYKRHKVAKDNKEAVKMAISAGIDMSMVPYNLEFYNDLIALVNEGEVSIERIDDAVVRILALKFKLGLFENPLPEEASLAGFGLPEYQDVAIEAARESLVLLKNDSVKNKPVLPISKNTKTLLAGPAADAIAPLHGSWSYNWQGSIEENYPETIITIKEALEQKVGVKNLNCVSPSGFHLVTSQHIASLKKQAQKADCIVLCLGEKSYAESPGNTNSLLLPNDQLLLAKAAIETGKPVILVLAEGRPLIIREIEGVISGIILAMRPGNKGADAIADILFGDYNPNGKLPFSYPMHTGNIIAHDDPVKNASYNKPQWPFGFGLSYTNFTFDEIKLNKDTLRNNEHLQISTLVTNIGEMEGKIAVDLFVHDSVASIIPPMKKLIGFQKINLKPGEKKEIEFLISKDDLSFINADLQRITEEGDFSIMIGDKTNSFYFKP